MDAPARFIEGITGGNISVAQAAMADTSSPEERSKVLGMIGAAFGLGFVLGPAMAGVLSGSDFGHHLLRPGACICPSSWPRACPSRPP